METNFKNTDFFIEEIDESVKDLTVHDSSVTHSPANTDFFIENIDNNVIEIASDRGITPSTVSVVPANTDFFIVNIDNNIKKIATDLSITPSSVQKTPANTDFFIENIYFNLILICEELNITPYEITVTPANTDFFIEAIAKNVEKIMEAQTEIHVSGTFIHAVLSADSEISDYELDGNATQTTYSGKNLFDISKVITNGTSVVNNGNGTLTINTPSGSSSVQATAPNKLSDYCPTLQVGDSVTFTMTTTGTNKYTYLYGTGANILWTSGQTKTITQAMLDASPLWYASGVSTSATISSIQIERGSATTYEPYVGGTASPNPDYPQTVNTVTGEQTVKVCGKNLFDKDNYNLFNGYLSGDPTGTITANASNDIFYIACQPSTTYTVSKTASKNFAVASSTVVPSAGSAFSGRVSANDQPSATITTDANAKYLLIWARNGNIGGETTRQEVLNTLQLELGSTATAYDPYQGQEFTIDLGSTELAKIGTYQDYIWNDGGTWKVHKAVGKVVLDGSDDESWQYTNGVCYTTSISDYNRSDNTPISEYFIGTTNVSGAGAVTNNTMAFASSNVSGDRLYIKYPDKFTSNAEIKTWLASNPATVYYALATPTTTEITDESLLAELNAIYDAELKEGVINISVTATSPNLPASLKATIIPKE